MFPSPHCPPVVNRKNPSELLIRLAALCLCAALYSALLFLIFQTLEKQRRTAAPVAGAMHIDFVQIEQQAEPEPMPEPEPVSEPEMQPEELEDADVAPEEPPKKPKPEPSPPKKPPVPDAPVAKVTQEAAAPDTAVPSDQVLAWVIEQIEKEKYYPPAAERFGLRGVFDLTVTVDQTGTIVSAEVLDGHGHRILRQALEKMLAKLPGRRFGQPTGELTDYAVTFEFE
jgi:outer membrane biosynthesis protein TonB